MIITVGKNKRNLIDWMGELNDAQWSRVSKSLEGEQMCALKKMFPQSSVQILEDMEAPFRVECSTSGQHELEKIQREIQHALEEIHERGTFWDEA